MSKKTKRLEQYFTPPEATRAFLDKIGTVNGLNILEPCNGLGWLSKELEIAGANVIKGDLSDEFNIHHKGVDFINDDLPHEYQNVDAIISNPPWSNAAQFVRRALEITPNVAMLLRLTFLEPCEGRATSSRVDLLQQLRACMVLPRLRFYHYEEEHQLRGTDTVPPAWFIWGFEGRQIKNLSFVTKDELNSYKDK